MSDLNLLRYYARLTPLGVGHDIKTTLPELSERLFTSPRHARNLLVRLNQLGWLTWTPKAGRHHRSSLLLHRELEPLKEQLAAKRVQIGKYERALAILDNDEVAFAKLLKKTSGATVQEGRLHIQLTYKRPFEPLLPHLPQRSSERFLIRQIYSCLVSSDANGHVHPELAHHWHYDPHTWQWTFYLRPELAFHNGAPLDANTIVSLFAKLSSLETHRAELAHISDIKAPTPFQVVFNLERPDPGFAGMISGVKYAIQPVSQLNYSQFHEGQIVPVIGCGPFEVQEHTRNKLKLKAFSQFYGCRALTDRVTIWQVDEERLSRPLIETNQPEANTTSHHQVSLSDSPHLTSAAQQQSRVEDGCLMVLFNQRAKQPLDQAQAHRLSELLNPNTIEQDIRCHGVMFGVEPAHNLLPSWRAVLKSPAPKVALPTQLTLALYNYTALQTCAQAIARLLAAQGITLSIHTYTYRELNQRAIKGELDETLVLTNINLDDNRHASAFAMLFSNPILHACASQDEVIWLMQQLNAVREQAQLPQYLEQLEPIASLLVSESWLAPLFHHRQTLRFHGVLHDVALTNWGWPDIRNVWSAD
ncbi:SgrR family transcriptional regulator [Vibrio cholerae]|uniref:SgrR family transcriptional regulator n=1 Tax=Vibrio cholerae TaxID=666 RepID=UPI00035C180B|nr:SgrR family transcriptional regulator [Vibrio cholerae]EGQ7978313.1 SgrR family transcriptional regulator [Vibrio cholerae]EGQ8529056.1 SgrR family transcriptional regulator [Vibrio cholerae]EGQ8558114.1 SgrR family transcriptional regulator [Vibrio cholerae]EGR2589946.1 SgrR family transcriptional regulator [Vibrio cholerae]EKG0007938.1 SgrR family transcriptional regulator [Vibrio cholerae]